MYKNIEYKVSEIEHKVSKSDMSQILHSIKLDETYCDRMKLYSDGYNPLIEAISGICNKFDIDLNILDESLSELIACYRDYSAIENYVCENYLEDCFYA